MPSQSEQLEREAGQTRAQLSRTVEELRGRMTPGQMIDQLTNYNYAREGPAAEFRRNLAREVRENPLPLVLIGIGIGWLEMSPGVQSRDDTAVGDGHDERDLDGIRAVSRAAHLIAALDRD